MANELKHPSVGEGLERVEWEATTTHVSSGLTVGWVYRASGATTAVFAAITASDLPTAIDAANIADGSVSNAEFQRLDGVTSDIQTQIDTKTAGPGSSTDHAVARYDSTTGKILLNSGVTIDDSNHITTAGNLIVNSGGTSGSIDGLNSLQRSGAHRITFQLNDVKIYKALLPSASSALDFGSSSLVWQNTYTEQMYISEQAAAGADIAAFGQIWVKTATPNTLWFTNDAGTDYSLVTSPMTGAFDVNDQDLNNCANILVRHNAELRFYDNGNYVGFEAPALSADCIWVLPTADGNANEFIQTDGSRTLSFAAGGAVSDVAYNATSWDGVTGIGPSKNAVRDELETHYAAADPHTGYSLADGTRDFTGGVTITGGADETQFTVTGNATQTSDILIVEKSNGVDVFKIEFGGEILIEHTADENDDRTFEIVTDAAAKGDVKAIDVDYITGSISAGEDEGIILINIDELAAGGGEIFGVEVLSTEGSAAVFGFKVGATVGAVHQDSGTFDDPTTGTDNTPSTDVPNMIDENSSNTTNIFDSDTHYIIIGAAAAFQEMEVVLTTGASGAGIKPKFEYSRTGSGVWIAFSPVDGTNGFRNTGIIAWDADDLTDHAVNTDTSTFDIKITRQRGSLGTTPVLGYIRVAATTEYIWDKDGLLTVAGVTINGTDGAAALTISDGDVVVVDKLYIFDDNGGEYLSGDGTDLTITSGAKINLTATSDVIIPVNIGLHFGDGAEKIESDNTDMTINSGVDINLTATTDINVPANVGVKFGDDGEGIEGDGTDLTITSSGVLNLTATGGVALNSFMQLIENAGITLDAALSADEKYCGIVEAGTAGATLDFGDCVYHDVTAGEWLLAKADVTATSGAVKVGINVTVAQVSDGNAMTVLLWGKVRSDSDYAFTVDAPVFISAATAGDLTSTAPTGTTNFVVRIIGYGNTADELFFCPDNTYLELA